MVMEAGMPERNAPAAPRRASAPIDPLHLARQSLGDPGLETEILIRFEEIIRIHAGRLERSQNVAELLDNLHTLRAASVGVGAWSLAQHAHVMESELKAGEPVEPERVADILMAVEEVCAYIWTRVPDETEAAGAAV